MTHSGDKIRSSGYEAVGPSRRRPATPISITSKGRRVSKEGPYCSSTSFFILNTIIHPLHIAYW
jgi:hypothetical protein